ncbi:MAG: lysophospholipid acyltransferase family protein [Kofleriaceae bacterium]
MKAFTSAAHIGRGLFNALAELGAVRMAPPKSSRDAAHRLAGALGAVARAHDLHVVVRGDVPRTTALVISNHVSYLDPLAILPMCPALPVAKGEVESWPIVGPIGASLGTMFVRRADPMARARVLRKIHDHLLAGTSVLNFAEGTTTRGDAVRPFWRGTFGIAQRLGVPIVPVAISYRDPTMAWCDGATFLPHYVQLTGRARVDVALTFGAPMTPRTGESPEAMAARVRGVVGHLLQHTRWNDAGLRTDLPTPRPDAVLSSPDGR